MTPSHKSLEEAKDILYRPLGNSLDPQWWADTQRLIAEALDRAKAEQRKEDARIAEKKFLSDRPELSMNTKALIVKVENALKSWDGNHPCEFVDCLIPVFDHYAKQKAAAIRSTAKEEK